MSMLPLFLAVIIGAKHFVNDPIQNPSGQKPVPLEEGSPITCELTYSAFAIRFIIRGPGEPAGKIVLQVRPGARNPSAPVPPLAFEVDLKKMDEGKDLLAPTAHTRETPHFPASIVTKRINSGKGWATRIHLPFRGRINKYWPICDGAKRPPLWFLTLKYTDANGKVTELGTAEDPAQIGWGKTPTWKQGRDELLRGGGPWGDHNLVTRYATDRAKYCDIYDFSQKERWIGYLDPGIETFVWRQADSEKIFFNAYAAEIANEYDEALKLLEYQLNEHKQPFIPPKSLKLADPAKDRLVKMVDDMNFTADKFAECRLEYLRDRFMGRKVKDPAVFKVKKPKSAAEKLKAPDVNVEEGAMTLDDEELQF